MTPSFTHVVDGGVGSILCSGVSPSPGLRCRFGTIDVPCSVAQGSETLCCVPPEQESDKEVLLQVLNQHDACLAKDVFVYSGTNDMVSKWSASCPASKVGGSCCPELLQASPSEVHLISPDQQSEATRLEALAIEDPAGKWETLPSAKALLASLSWVDRLLPVWIIGAMVLGVVLGYFTSISDKLDVVQIDSVSLPIAVGLWMMMWPVLCKVKYELLWGILGQRSVWAQLGTSLLFNWVVGPLLMTGLAWATLPDLPGFRNGVIMVGIARCIAMVLIWNQMAQGSPEYCAILVAVNSVMQIVLFAPLSMFYLQVVSRQYQGDDQLDINFWQVCRSVLIYLGAPLAAGIITRFSVIRATSQQWFNRKFMAWVAPLALVSLVYTVIIIFALQGKEVIDHIGSVCRVAVPMVLYFSSMWASLILFCRWRGFSYEHTVTQAFTAASNNFELAIAIAVGTFGVRSQEALAATVGPLIEVPALLALVYVALWLHKRLDWDKASAAMKAASASHQEASPLAEESAMGQ